MKLLITPIMFNVLKTAGVLITNNEGGYYIADNDRKLAVKLVHSKDVDDV